MLQYRFEIVGRAFERFTWRLVELRGSRHRVLARDDQDYSTLPKVEEAIAAFRVIVRDAGRQHDPAGCDAIPVAAHQLRVR